MQHIQFTTLATLLPFIGVLIATLVWVIRGIGTSKASMDAYDYFTDRELENERTADADERNHFIRNHQPECSGSVTMFAQWEDDDGQPRYEEISACTTCMNAHEEEGYTAVVMPDAPIDLRAYVMHKAMQERTKQAFAKVITLHPEQAA